MGFLVSGAALVACGSSSTDSSPRDRVTTTESTATSSRITDMPDDWEARVTEGPEREATVRLLDGALGALGPERSGTYDQGDAFEVRVVEPTPHDKEVVARLQAQTSIPLKLVAVPMSARWLEQTALRLDADLSNPAIGVGVDLDAGRLTVSVDRQVDPDLGGNSFTAKVHEFVAGYLAQGQQGGSVADGVTADQAVEIGEGHFG